MKKIRQKKYRSKILFSVLALFLGIISFRFLSERDVYAPVAHRNLVDTKISNQTNQPIFEGASKINPEFTNLTFKTESSSFLKNQIANSLEALKNFGFKTLENPTVKERGSWIWTPTLLMTSDYIDSIVNGAKENKINVLYVSIDSYLDIFSMPKGTERNTKKQLFVENLSYLIKKANQANIQVEAEAGWQNWAEPGNEYKGLVIVNFVKSFNEKNQYKFRGFQYDVEPYLLPRFENEPESVLKNFLGLIEKTQNFIGEDDLRFSVVIPDFYDEGDGMIPNLFYRGKKASAFKHLLSILDKKENGSVIIMSYRNFAEGPDGSIEVTRNELNTALKGKHRTSLIIAQETANVPPPYITFHNTSKQHLEEQIKIIDQVFGKYKNFGGFAIHHINSLLALK